MEATTRLVVLPGVFRPRSDSWMLTESLAELSLPDGAETLDLCTGSGVAAIAAARLGARATAVDVSRRSILTVRLNARRNGVSNNLRAIRGDLFAGLAGRAFHAITSNPPYVPSGSGALPTRGPSRAWEAGPDGRVVLDRICAEAPGHLRPGGTLLLVHSSLCGTERTLDLLCARGLDASVVRRRRGPLGPLMLARVRELERRGVLAVGEREEEVVVVEARRPA
ncbi:MAG: release factor glutamine methyltransferase [Thermoleophilaceae bacterium]|jgi:release factor glutamine methyltransferase|nr:release factor glutamine methyltransferase [Thermoleophilaceae bacterium]